MLNKVQIIGRLGRDPEVKYMQTGTPVCSLNIATDSSYVDREGNKVDKTEWHRVSAFDRQAETCGQFLRKGSLVYVEGSLTTRKWQDNQGQDRYTTEIRAQRIIFLDKKGGDSGDGDSYQQQGAAPRNFSKGKPSDNRGYEDMGPAFPSEASSMDDVPF